MNRRALRLVITTLMVATLGVIAAPGVAIGDPIADKQAEAQQLEAQISSNADKLSGLNEQMHSTENELAEANADIQAADALVAAAKSKTKELRAEVALRAAAVYTQSGSSSGVEELDAKNAQDLSSKQKYSSLAAAARQRDRQRARQGEGAGDRAQGRRRRRSPGRAEQEGRAASAAGQARSRSGRAREAEREGHRRDQGARGAGRGGASGPRRPPKRGRSTTSRSRRPSSRPRRGTPAATRPAVAVAGAVAAAAKCHSPAREWRRVGGARVRVRAARQAVLLRRRRPGLLRLLRAHDDGVGAGRRLHVPRLLRPARVVPAGLDGPAPAR